MFENKGLPGQTGFYKVRTSFVLASSRGFRQENTFEWLTADDNRPVSIQIDPDTGNPEWGP